jgi:hypothetical protein
MSAFPLTGVAQAVNVEEFKRRTTPGVFCEEVGPRTWTHVLEYCKEVPLARTELCLRATLDQSLGNYLSTSLVSFAALADLRLLVHLRNSYIFATRVSCSESQTQHSSLKKQTSLYRGIESSRRCGTEMGDRDR